ncbi:MAG: hypothetical protein IKD06_02660 [Clostridia bacterium]|nr:hypothetical protein [Clostridia bacterium]
MSKSMVKLLSLTLALLMLAGCREKHVIPPADDSDLSEEVTTNILTTLPYEDENHLPALYKDYILVEYNDFDIWKYLDYLARVKVLKVELVEIAVPDRPEVRSRVIVEKLSYLRYTLSVQKVLAGSETLKEESVITLYQGKPNVNVAINRPISMREGREYYITFSESPHYTYIYDQPGGKIEWAHTRSTDPSFHVTWRVDMHQLGAYTFKCPPLHIFEVVEGGILAGGEPNVTWPNIYADRYFADKGFSLESIPGIPDHRAYLVQENDLLQIYQEMLADKAEASDPYKSLHYRYMEKHDPERYKEVIEKLKEQAES